MRVILLLLISISVQARELAITIDDLPIIWASEFSDEEQFKMVRQVYDTFDRFSIKVVAFPIPAALVPKYKILIDELVERGHKVGNHTFSHPDFNNLTIEEFKNEILKAELELKPWVKGQKYFRYPSLHHGDTLEKKLAIEKFLKDNGYKNVTATIDDGQWLYSQKYSVALNAGKIDEAKAIGKIYLDYVFERAEFFENFSNQKLGRGVKHILVLHMDPITSHHLGELLKGFKDRGWSFVTPEQAMADPVYQMEDRYVGPYGLRWLDRVFNYGI